MAVNQIELVVERLRSPGECGLRDGPSLSAAIRRRRDSVATHERCPDGWTATGRTGRRVAGSLEQPYAHRALSRLHAAPSHRTP